MDNGTCDHIATCAAIASRSDLARAITATLGVITDAQNRQTTIAPQDLTRVLSSCLCGHATTPHTENAGYPRDRSRDIWATRMAGDALNPTTTSPSERSVDRDTGAPRSTEGHRPRRDPEGPQR